MKEKNTSEEERRCIYCGMAVERPEKWSQKNCPLLGNGSINTIAATDTHATVKEVLDAMPSVRFVPILYSETRRENLTISAPLEIFQGAHWSAI
jgi:predicted RNA-binding Zn-ribbon protein involved in translation (DUF1610 family)